jgi:hypothetical protein
MSTVLHVGNDICYRIPLMEQRGLIAKRIGFSVRALEAALGQNQTYSGIAFHYEAPSPLRVLAEAARSLSNAPRILFLNSLIEYDEKLFDLVIPVQTSPVLWLRSLEETIKEACGRCDASKKLRQECANVRSVSRELRRISGRNRARYVQDDALRRGSPE